MQKIDPKTNRNFAFIMTSGFLVVGAGIPFIKGHAIHLWAVILATLFFLSGLFVPHLLEKPRHAWIWLGEKLGAINSRVLLTLLYGTLFSFIHLIFLLIGRDKMMSAWKKYPTTYKEKKSISAFRDPF